MRIVVAVALALFALVGASRASAQETAMIAVGDEAPDFELAGATRHGILADPVRLSSYRGETVVLAFFFRVRTRG